MKTLCFGEILFDRIDGVDHFGGASVNVAVHLSRMGADSYMISGLGNDDPGREALKTIEAEEVKTNFLELNSPHPTGLVEVLVEKGMPTYNIIEGAAWDNIDLTETQVSSLLNEEWDLVYCGTLAQRTESNRELLADLLARLNYRHLFFDVNLRQHYYSGDVIKATMEHTTIIKLNEEELPVVGPLIFKEELSAAEFYKRASEEFALELLVLTLGSEGAEIYYDDLDGGKIIIPPEKVKVNDTVGAGDSFSSAFLYQLLNGIEIEEAGTNASKLAAFVVRHAGALPAYDEEVKTLLNL